LVIWSLNPLRGDIQEENCRRRVQDGAQIVTHSLGLNRERSELSVGNHRPAIDWFHQCGLEQRCEFFENDFVRCEDSRIRVCENIERMTFSE